MVLIPFSCIDDKEDEINLEDILTVGDSLPDFTVSMNDGCIITGASLRESVSVIVFFHTSCPDCRQVLPHIQSLYDNYSAQGVTFALISREEEINTIEQFWQSQNFTMPYSAQPDRTIYELFAKTRVPRVYISDNKGIIRAFFTDNPVPDYIEIETALINALS